MAMAPNDIFDFDNVFFDQHSTYSFAVLNESLYIQNLILELAKILDRRFSEYDFYVFSEHKTGKLPASKDIDRGKKKVLLYFSDESAQDVAHFADNYFAIFKSYIGASRLASNVFPLGIGYVKDVPVFPLVDIADRKYDVFFQGNLNTNRIDFYRAFSPLRRILPSQKLLKTDWYSKLLLRLADNFNGRVGNSILVFNRAFKSGLNRWDYGKLLSESKIILCPKGFTQTECFRHYEAMRAGCVIVSEKLPDVPFYTGSPIIQVANWQQGIQVVEELLRNQQQLREVQLKTVQWWEDVCSERGMAKYIETCLAGS